MRNKLSNADYMAKFQGVRLGVYRLIFSGMLMIQELKETDINISHSKVEMDEYSRLIPCLYRFPSSVNGQGLKPLADYIHSLGLKFGIHIMRGIPRNAVHNHMKILGSDATANEQQILHQSARTRHVWIRP